MSDSTSSSHPAAAGPDSDERIFAPLMDQINRALGIFEGEEGSNQTTDGELDREHDDTQQPREFVLYCKPKDHIAASAALILEAFDVRYRVEFDDESSGLDLPPALQDPDIYNLIFGRKMLPHLMSRLDAGRTCLYDDRPGANEAINDRINRLYKQIDTGDFWQWLHDMEFYLQKFKCRNIVGIKVTLADIVFFPLAFEIYSTHLAHTGLFPGTGRWYRDWALRSYTTEALGAVGWSPSDPLFMDLVARRMRAR
ncbi:hypothetical protein BJX64DRAFT_285772 [Aspergillus heterothallicus]